MAFWKVKCDWGCYAILSFVFFSRFFCRSLQKDFGRACSIQGSCLLHKGKPWLPQPVKRFWPGLRHSRVVSPAQRKAMVAAAFKKILAGPATFKGRVSCTKESRGSQSSFLGARKERAREAKKKETNRMTQGTTNGRAETPRSLRWKA